MNDGWMDGERGVSERMNEWVNRNGKNEWMMTGNEGIKWIMKTRKERSDELKIEKGRIKRSKEWQLNEKVNE